MKLEAGRLLVNLGFPIFRFLGFDIFYFLTINLGKSGFDISKKNDKSVMGRAWTKRRVLRAISSTLKFQYFRKS